MARIELRHCDIRLKDGLSGAAELGAAAMAPDDVDVDITDVVLNTDVTNMVPVGARFTVVGETTTVIHTVTARTPASAGPTTNVVFSPKLGAGTYTTGDTVTFLPQQIDIKVGDGNLSYTEHKAYDYLLDRGNLDTVREGNEVPMDVKLECTYEHITTGTSEDISPMDAFKGVGAADEWVSSSADPCEPYSVDLEVLHTPPCGDTQTETTLFPDLRVETKEVNFKDATINCTGKCNATEPIVTRT